MFAVFCEHMRTKGQLKACIQQHLVWRRIGGATDLIFPHEDFRIKRRPLSWSLLRNEEREAKHRGEEHQGSDGS